MKYESVIGVESSVAPGVRFLVYRMSFERRVELTRRIRDLAQKVEYLEAGANPQEKIDAALLTAEIDRLYVLWGLKEIAGLNVDGRAATPQLLAASGPEELFREALAAVKNQCGLSAEERKN